MQTKMNSQAIYNDIVDEQIEFNEETLPENKKIKNQIMDEEINLSEDSLECVSNENNRSQSES